MDISLEPAKRIRELAKQNWWMTNEELLASEGIEVKNNQIIAVMSSIVGRKDAIRRRVEIPQDYLGSLNQVVGLLREYADSTDELVTLAGFNEFLESRDLESLDPGFMWRTLTELAGVEALKRRPQAFSYDELVSIVNRFLSERNASGYTLDDFRKWLFDWHGADLSQVIRLTLGGNSWNRTKGLIFLLHKQGALVDEGQPQLPTEFRELEL